MDWFTFVFQDELDSEGEERGRDKTKKHNKDNLRLKKRFNALLKKIKINDDALVEANDVLPPEEFSQVDLEVSKD